MASKKAKRTRPTGRPTKLNPERQERLLSAIKGGAYPVHACAYAGVCYDTLREWITRGEREGAGIYFDFSEAMKKAEADAEMRGVLRFQDTIQDDWKGWATFLERRFPERWARQSRMALPNQTIVINPQQGSLTQQVSDAEFHDRYSRAIELALARIDPPAAAPGHAVVDKGHA